MNQLVQIGRIKHLLDKKTLLLLISSFFFFSLIKRFYCSSVWGNTSKRNLHKLQLEQTFAARVVFGWKKFDHISQGWRSLKWLDVSEKVSFNDLVLVVSIKYVLCMYVINMFCLIYENLFIKEKKPSLDTQSDTIREKY